jgi:hypothetical protein
MLLSFYSMLENDAQNPPRVSLQVVKTQDEAVKVGPGGRWLGGSIFINGLILSCGAGSGLEELHWFSEVTYVLSSSIQSFFFLFFLHENISDMLFGLSSHQNFKPNKLLYFITSWAQWTKTKREAMVGEMRWKTLLPCLALSALYHTDAFHGEQQMSS